MHLNIMDVDIDDFDPGIFVDDRSGDQLNTKKTRTARRTEIRTMEEMKVYRKIPRRMMPQGAILVDARWLDSNKAPPRLPADVRSLIVA